MSGLRTSAEYTTASEDEEETDTAPSTAEQSPQPFAQHSTITDSEAEKVGRSTQAHLDQGMREVVARAKALGVRE